MLRTHLVLPDMQVKAGVDLSHLPLIGRYIIDKKPEVIVMIGDFADMPSLSSYDIGKKSFEGRRYKTDIAATRYAMGLLMSPLIEFNRKAKENHQKRYYPELHLTLGNHEDRITRVIENDPKLDGTIDLSDLGYTEYGWQVHPYLRVVNIDGVSYSHFFVSGAMCRPVSSARALITKKHSSCTMGHTQKFDYAVDYLPDGREITGLMVSTAYLHDEGYLGEQGNLGQKRHIIMKYRVNQGSYDLHMISLDYLFEHYEAERGKFMYKG